MKSIERVSSEVELSMMRTAEQVGSTVNVYNGKRKLIETYDALDLGADYFIMGKKEFYSTYGFHYVPRGVWWARSEKKAEQRLTLRQRRKS